MKKITMFTILVGAALIGLGQDSLFCHISGDTLSIYHTATERNCGAAFTYTLDRIDNQITLTEVDTGGTAFCVCTFDLRMDITGLEPGAYHFDVWGHDLMCEPVYYGSLDIEWGNLGIVAQDESECLATRDDTSFIELSVAADTLNLFWNTPMLNCIFMPVWSGWLSADTFHVTMVDTGPPVDCICPFEVEASFASFPPGSYTLDFWGGEYGYPSFTINAGRDEPTLGEGFQSACYDPSSLKDGHQEPVRMNPVGIGLIQCYPNPFNGEVTVSYEVLDQVALEIEVFSVDGRLISVLGPSKSTSPGTYTFVWNAKDRAGQPLSSGIYLLVFRNPQGFRVNRLVFLG